MTAAVAGRYRIERPLGRGGMARVDLARDVELDRLVAVKVLAPELAADPELRQRFVQEGRLAARLGHPNVVGILDAGEEDGVPFIVMEYVDGETLADVVRRRGPLPWQEAVGLAAQALAGLEHAHAAGLVHRDVKPGNLLLRADGQLKVADFGIARAAETSGITRDGTILGTAGYLAPEQARGERVGPEADVYGAAAVVYELLTGRPPRQIASLEELVAAEHEPIPPVGALEPSVPPDVEEAVMRGLAADPRRRPSARELRSLLAADAPTGPLAAHGPTAILDRPPRRHRTGRVPTAWLVVGAASLALLAGAIAATRSDDDDQARQPGPATPARGPQAGATPEETARNLSEWLRANARGG
jgi:serine/threonine-protein kinase